MGKVTGAFPDGFTLPKSRSATMLPSSCPGNHTSRIAGPWAPRSQGASGRATPALSFSTSAVFCPMDGPALMTASIMARVRLFRPGFSCASSRCTTLLMRLGFSAYQSSPSPRATGTPTPWSVSKVARSAFSSAMVPAMMITASAALAASRAGARLLFSSSIRNRDTRPPWLKPSKAPCNPARGLTV